MVKLKTNEQMLKSLLKEIEGTINSALLRERIVWALETTLKDIEQNPKGWEYGFIHPNFYKELNTIVQKHIGFENN
jgi:hypothetical protein